MNRTNKKTILLYMSAPEAPEQLAKDVTQPESPLESLNVPPQFKAIFKPGARLTADYLNEHKVGNLLNGHDSIEFKFSSWENMGETLAQQIYAQAYPTLVPEQKYFVLILELIIKKQIRKEDFGARDSFLLVFQSKEFGSGVCWARQFEGDNGAFRYVADLNLPLNREMEAAQGNRDELKMEIAWEAIRRIFPQISRIRMQTDHARENKLSIKEKAILIHFRTFLTVIETASRIGLEYQAGIETDESEIWFSMPAQAWDILNRQFKEEWKALYDAKVLSERTQLILGDVLSWQGPLIEGLQHLSVIMDTEAPNPHFPDHFQKKWRTYAAAAEG